MTKHHKRQHYIPQSYMEAWCDPNTPLGHRPYVWRFSKDSGQVSRKSPEKLFFETDMYTILTPEGDRDLHLEYNLSSVEGEFVQVRKDKLEKKQEIASEEHFVLCMFVAAMAARTKGYAKHQSNQWQRALNMAEKMQSIIDTATPEESKQMRGPSNNRLGEENPSFSIDEVREIVKKPIQSMLSSYVIQTAPLLYKTPYVILETANKSFITSDDPCVWFDPAYYQKPKPFGAGGLISPTLEVTLPLSPKQMVLFSTGLRLSDVYISIDDAMVDDFNKRTKHFSYEFFISNNSKV